MYKYQIIKGTLRKNWPPVDFNKQAEEAAHHQEWLLTADKLQLLLAS